MCASFCPRYEDGIDKRTAAENEFVGLRKVSELAWAVKAPLWARPPHKGAEPALGHRDRTWAVGLTLILTVLR